MACHKSVYITCTIGDVLLIGALKQILVEVESSTTTFIIAHTFSMMQPSNVIGMGAKGV